MNTFNQNDHWRKAIKKTAVYFRLICLITICPITVWDDSGYGPCKGYWNKNQCVELETSTLPSAVTASDVGPALDIPISIRDATADYVEVFDGDMPLMFAVGHGGWKQVGEQENGGYAADPLLRDYFYRVLAVRIYEETGHLPYIVYQQGNRNYVNTNRPVGYWEAYHADNTKARDAYFEFHNQVDTMIARIEDRYGADMVLMINPHTADLDASVGDRPWDRIADIGFITSVTNLGSSANTMQALYDRKGEVALRGEDSIPYQLFHGQDWPTPDAVWPAAATTNSRTLAKTGEDVWHVLPAWVTGWGSDDWVTAYYNGWATINYHGTNNLSNHYADWSNGLDAFQIEFNYSRYAGISLHPTDPEYDPSGSYYQLDIPFTTALMDDFIDAIIRTLQTNYNWTPGGVYNVVVDNDDTGFSVTGSWNESTGLGFWGTPSIFTGETGATATWTPSLDQTGIYEVLIRWTDVGTRTHNAQYTVNYAGGAQTFTIDQDGGRDAKWVSLGSFDFDAGAGGSVVLECSGSEGSTAADATLFRLLTGNEIIIDNLDPEFATAGNWHESLADDEYAGSSLYAEDADNEPGSATATWTPNLPQAGTYKFFAWWTYWHNRAQNAPYTITHANGSDTVRVNQRENASQWVLLGVYEFNSGTAGNVTLTREAGDDVTTSADAIKFVKAAKNIYLPLVFNNN